MAHEQDPEKAKEMPEEGTQKARHFAEEGLQKGREIAEDIGEKIKNNPWPFIAGAAAIAFFLGFFMRGSRRD